MSDTSQNLETIINATPAMRILKAASCPTCSAKATVGYHVGSNANQEIYFRVIANSGGGLFSAEWVPLNAIKSAFENATR